MTTALWILLAAALFLIAFNLLRVGVDAEYDGESLFLRAKAGPIRITILPKKLTAVAAAKDKMEAE